MSSASLPLPRAGGRVLERARAVPLPPPELVGLLVFAAVLYLWGLSRNGFANEYYSAAARSMSTDWHAFLYGSFDAAGVMTVDKPPLALWVQALSARLFGLSSWSLLIPQALMGVATVGFTYDLVRRVFGRPAGFAAGAVLAVTPIVVAISRHNNPDALVMLACTAALWCTVRWLGEGRLRWALLAGVCVGLGFEAKMGVALMVVPGIAAACLWAAPRGRCLAARHLAAGGGAMAAVALAWPVLVWLTPAGSRPWVGGTSDNSIWSLITGYNGLGRVFGQAGGPGGGGPGGPVGPGGPGGPAAGNGGPFGGEPGLLRLFNESMGGQVAWLLGFALVAGVGLVVLTRMRRGDVRTGWLIAVGGAALVTAVAFSRAAGIFHPYYVSFLAPFVAALVGAGVGESLRGGRTARVLGPAVVAGGVMSTLMVIGTEVVGFDALVPVLVVGGAAAAGVLAVTIEPRVRAVALAGALTLLLVAPASWAFDTLDHATSGTFPAGGPASASFAGGPGGPGGPPGARGGPGPMGGAPRGAPPGPPPGAVPGGPGGPPPLPPGAGPTGRGPGGAAPLPPPGAPQGALPGGPPRGGPFGGATQNLRSALAYARSHGGGTVAVDSQAGASRSVTEGADVAALGGFSGRESQVSAGWLADAVEAGRVRWVLAGSGGGPMPADGRVGARDVMSAVTQACAPVSAVDGLYDCRGRASSLRSQA